METQAQEGRQTVVLSPSVNIKFLLEIHMSTPPRETLCTTLGVFDRLGITCASTQHSGLVQFNSIFAHFEHPPTVRRVNVPSTRNTSDIHRHTFNCLLLFSLQSKENHGRSCNQDFSL